MIWKTGPCAWAYVFGCAIILNFSACGTSDHIASMDKHMGTLATQVSQDQQFVASATDQTKRMADEMAADRPSIQTVAAQTQALTQEIHDTRASLEKKIAELTPEVKGAHQDLHDLGGSAKQIADVLQSLNLQVKTVTEDGMKFLKEYLDSNLKPPASSAPVASADQVTNGGGMQIPDMSTDPSQSSATPPNPQNK